jgi:tetratricopeptide (TPR) repeat protein
MEKNKLDDDLFLFLSEAKILLQQNKHLEALVLAQNRLRQLPCDVDAYVVAAHAFIAMKNTEESENILKTIEDLITDLSSFYIRVGDIYREKGFFHNAANCYKKYISLHPSSEKTKEVVDKIVLLEQEAPLLADMEETGDTGKSEPEFYTITLADLYIRQGHFAMAAEILEKIIKNEPDNEIAKSKLDTVNTAMALQASAKADAAKADFLIETMTQWLKNINRLKDNGRAAK